MISGILFFMEYIEISNMLLPYSIFRYFVFSVGFFLACIAIYFLYSFFISLKKFWTDSDNFVSTDSILSVTDLNKKHISPSEDTLSVDISEPDNIVSTSQDKPEDSILPYKKRDLLTKTENKFHYVLSLVIGDKYVIHPKVGLKDLVELKDKNQISLFNKIAQKHIDFVICDKRYLKPLCAIELDDYTHRWKSSEKRDSDKDKILRSAGIPLRRFEVSPYYNQEDIKNRLKETLHNLEV
jgi:very-short-patch-repair endonuclease